MMTQTQALATLAREDPDAAGDARAALAWLAGDDGLGTISLLRLQEFLWYALPVKWPMTTDAQVGVARALGRVLMLAGMDRYAGVCDSPRTERIITSYADGHEEGIAAYTEAIDASNAAPPDTELLAWGSVMGPQERAAYDACAAALELAFAAGELSVGARGWRTRRLDLVNRWLTCQSLDASDTWLSRISAERIDAWARGRSGDRSRLARAVIPRLLEPPAIPDDPLPTLSWLLDQASDGVRLTARHYIAPAVVTEAVNAFGWRDKLVGSLRTELDVFPLHTLRGMAQKDMGALRRSKASLVLTGTGKLMAADPSVRWHIGTAALIGSDDGPHPDFSAAVREAALLMILTSPHQLSYEDMTSVLTDIHVAEGWAQGDGPRDGRDDGSRDGRGEGRGDGPQNGQRGADAPAPRDSRSSRPKETTALANAVRTELYNLRHRLWALHLLGSERTSGARISLTDDGVAAALSALLARALRPRHHLPAA